MVVSDPQQQSWIAPLVCNFAESFLVRNTNICRANLPYFFMESFKVYIRLLWNTIFVSLLDGL